MDVNRGTTNLIHFTADDMPYGGPLTTSALVVAGETLDVSFLQGGKQTDLTTVFTATSIPEPAGLLLLALGLVVARRRAS